MIVVWGGGPSSVQDHGFIRDWAETVTVVAGHGKGLGGRLAKVISAMALAEMGRSLVRQPPNINRLIVRQMMNDLGYEREVRGRFELMQRQTMAVILAEI